MRLPKTNRKSQARLPTKPSVRFTRITPKQYKVIKLLWAGYTRNEISKELKIAKGTVNRHISDAIKTTNTTSTISMCIKVFKKKYKIE